MHQHAHGGGPQQPTPSAIPGVKSIIAVGSGKGGVGKTTLAVNLSLALARLGFRVGLLDADIYGPNVPLMLGATEQPQVTSQQRIVAPERFGVRTISVGLLNPGDKPLVWRGPMLHSVVRQFLSQVEWGELDYLVVDLPPGTGDVVISLTQTVPLTGAVVVTTPSDVSLQDARKAIEMFKQVKVELIGIIENMSYFVCPHCNHEVDPFGKGGGERTAKQFGVPFLGQIELDQNIREGGDSGHPVVLGGENSRHAQSLFKFARKVIERVDELNAADTGSVLTVD
jgi:ATP-binding protein involved in chromosome partitioning